MILPRLEKVFQMCCLLLAIYWITYFTAEFRENKDMISISMKTFNDDPTDKYPSFTLCFQGDKFHWYHDENIFDSYALNATQYELLLKGHTAMMDEINKMSRLYTKKPVILNDGQNINFNRFHLRPADFLYELKYFTEKATNDVYFLNDGNHNKTLDAYIQLSYQVADNICFTRKSNDPLKSIRLHDLVTFNSSVIKRYNDTEIQVFIHHPNHLIASFDKPKYKASFQYLMDTLSSNTGQGAKTLEFKISQIKQLRKRSDSNAPCTYDIIDYDRYFQEEVNKELRCVPPYWRDSFSDVDELEECKNVTSLQDAHLKIAEPKSILEGKQFPCYEMILLSIDSINNNPSPEPKDISMAFYYPEKTYEEIKYSRMMGFDGWLSNVGGFVGIFLGYSMLQIPEFFVCILGLFHTKKFIVIKGM